MSGRSENIFRDRIVQRTNKKEVEKKTRRIAQHESYFSHRSEFEEASQTGFAKAWLRQELAQQKEAKLGRVALILVRREALRNVLEEERQLYNKELSLKGLAIYQQRI